nr:proline-rich protein 36-like [Setaria viridis]
MASWGVSHFTANRAEGLFSGRTIDAAPDVWAYGSVEKEKRKISDLLQTIGQLKREGLTGAGGPAQRVLQEPARTAPQGLAQRAPQEPVRIAPQGAAQDVPQGSAQDLPQGGARGASSGSSQGAPQERAWDAPSGPARDAAPASSRSAPQGPSDTSPHGVTLRLAPKKMLRTSSSSGGRAATPLAAIGGVPGAATGPPTEVAAAEPVVGTAAESAAGGGADSTPPVAPPVAPPVRAVIPPGPQAGEVINLDADEAEEAETTEGKADAPVAMAGSEVEGALGPEDAAATEAAVPETGVSVPVAPAGVTLVAETEVPPGVPLAGSAATIVQPPGPSTDSTLSGIVMSSSTATSESALVPPSASPVPGVWRGPVLRWTSRDDPPRRLYALDDAAEWHRWQAMHGGVAQVQSALTSALGVLANTVVPGSQALQEGSREKSDFLRRQRNLWEHYNTERERSRASTGSAS